MKKIFILSLISLLLSCSNSEDDNNIPAEQTFLENHKNSIWVELNADDSVGYRFFENNLNLPVTKFYDSPHSDDCYYLNMYGTTPEILENNNTTLKLKYFYSNQEYEIITYTINDDKLTEEFAEFYYDNLNIWNYTYVETYTNIEDYVFCENDDID